MSDLDNAAKTIAGHMHELAAAIDVSDHTLYKAVKFFIPKEQGGTGGRPRVEPGSKGYEPNRWLVRVMIFNYVQDLVADTMPGQDLVELPDMGMPTLAALGDAVREIAYQWHAAENDPQPVGLDEGTLNRRILALRVNLSRSGGETWWKVPYMVGDRAWQINVKVHRSTGEEDAPRPQAPTSLRSSEHRREAPAGSPEQRFGVPTD